MKRRAMCAAVVAAGMVCATAPFLPAASVRAYDAMEKTGDVEIDEDHFPDEEFRAVIAQDFDQDENGVLSQQEITEAKELNCLGQYIYDLTGIEYLTELEVLYCGFNNLREIDISHNTKLKELDCYDAKLTSLDLSHNTELEKLCCADNKLTELDLTSNTKLKYVECFENLISNLDLSRNTELVYFDCYSNHLKALDTSKNPKLEVLSCGYNPITSVDVSANPKLQEFWCYSGALTTIDLSHHPDLHIVSLAENPLSELYLFDCPVMLNLMQAHPLEREVNPVTGTEYLFSEFELEKDGEPLQCFIYFNASATLITDKEAPAPETPAPSTPEPATQTFERFIERLYTVALNRPSDASGKAFWLNKVQNEGATGADCARGFLIESSEFGSRGLNDDQFVRTLYKTFFDREADDAGYAFWMQKIAGGMSRAQVIEGFIDATEWCNLCASFGVKSGAKTAKATVPSENALKFATRLYTECLGRDPEADGLQFWALRLTNLESSGYEGARDFFNSTEFQNKNVDDETYVKLLYRTFMGRDYDQGGLEFWLGHLATDMTRLQVLQGFAQSQEFTNICNQYGIDRGTI